MTAEPRKRKPHRKSRPSTVDRLDPAIRDEIYRLRFSLGRTVEEIREHLAGMGYDQIPGSRALSRHLKAARAEIDARLQLELAKLTPQMAFANALADSILERVEGLEPDLKLRAIRELLQGQIIELLLTPDTDEAGNPIPRSVKEMFTISRTVQTLAQAERTEDARMAEKLEQAKNEVRGETIAKVEDMARKKQGGMSAETVAMIRHAVLGDA